jgi:hypothetical protein
MEQLRCSIYSPYTVQMYSYCLPAGLMIKIKKICEKLVAFGLECAPVRCAHPSLWAHCHANGALRAPLHPSQLLIQPPNIYKIYRTWAAHVKGFFLSTGPHADWSGYEIWGPLPPASPIVASLILPAIIWGQNYVPVRPNAQIFFGFSFFVWFWDFFFLLFSSFYFLLIHLFLSFSSYLFSTILRLLILLFLYFKLFVVLQTWNIRHSEGFFEGVKPLLIHLGSKLMYTVRSYILTFLFNPFLLDFDLFFLLRQN